MKQKNSLFEERNQKLCSQNLFVCFLAISLLLLTNCTKEIKPEPESGGDLFKTTLNKAKTKDIVVNAGSSIQAAVNIAAAGTVIKLKPGTYKENITVDKKNITLRGEGSVIIQNPGSAEIGILVKPGADGFVLENVTVRDFTERGVMITYADGFLFSHVTVINDGEFGLFSEYCRNGKIEHCEGSGNDETGVFVGQSTNVLVTHNKMYENVIGLETENSSFVTFDQNQAYDNAVGIFCSLVPNRIVTTSTGVVITKNQVRDNNHQNFAGAGEQEQILPSGTGILILGTDNTLVKDNHVTGNKFTGIAVLSTAIYALLGLPIDGIEPNPDGVKIVSNQVKGNGYDPQSLLPFPVPGVDLLWLQELGPGTGNCWSKNLYSTSYPESLPTCP